jgi:hypothetical protein
MLFLLFCFFIVFVFLSLFNSKKYTLNNKIISFLSILLIIFAAIRPENFDRDYNNYNYMFNDPYFLVEPTFLIISSFIHKYLYSEIIFLFTIYAFLGVSIKILAIRQISKLFYFSLLIYFTNFYLLHELTQIRVGVASGILLLCIKPIFEGNLKKFIFFVFFASLFHYSALIIFPLWFLRRLNNSWILGYIIPFSYFLYFLGFNIFIDLPFPAIKEKMDLIKSSIELGGDSSKPINVFNIYQLGKIAIFYICLYKFDLIIKSNKYALILLGVFCISLAVVPLLSSIQVVGFRISELFGIVEIIIFPFLYYIFSPKWVSKFIIIVIASLTFFFALFYNNLFEF